MVEGNNPEKAVVDFGPSKSLTDNRMEGMDSNFVQTNGLDWISFPSTTKQFLDPEEVYQKNKKNKEKIKKTLEGKKLEEYTKLFLNEKEMRDEAKQSALWQNLMNSSKHLAVVEFAQLTLAQNQRFYFKKGSVLYNFDGKVFWRTQDLLKRDKATG